MRKKKKEARLEKKRMTHFFYKNLKRTKKMKKMKK